jgi:chromosome segregation ATPase
MRNKSLFIWALLVALLGLASPLAPGLAPEAQAQQQGGEPPCPTPLELDKQIKAKKAEKAAAEKDLKAKQKAYDKAKAAIKKFAEKHEKEKDKINTDAEKKKLREERLKLLEAFKAAREALEECKAKLAKICEELAELEKKKAACAPKKDTDAVDKVPLDDSAFDLEAEQPADVTAIETADQCGDPPPSEGLTDEELAEIDAEIEEIFAWILAE